MKISDKVIADGSIGVICAKYYKDTSFDWEVAFITDAPCNCWLDCYKESQLKLYEWRPYPKTLKQMFKTIHLYISYTLHHIK